MIECTQSLPGLYLRGRENISNRLGSRKNSSVPKKKELTDVQKISDNNKTTDNNKSVTTKK